jgi:hypothetical protein
MTFEQTPLNEFLDPPRALDEKGSTVESRQFREVDARG